MTQPKESVPKNSIRQTIMIKLSLKKKKKKLRQVHFYDVLHVCYWSQKLMNLTELGLYLIMHSYSIQNIWQANKIISRWMYLIMTHDVNILRNIVMTIYFHIHKNLSSQVPSPWLGRDILQYWYVHTPAACGIGRLSWFLTWLYFTKQNKQSLIVSLYKWL